MIESQVMLNVGLTGGIGSGKSTVARFLENKGAVHLDIDLVAHEVEQPGKPVWREIVAAFGTSILREDRSIDREKLGKRVFRDPPARELLNRIVHPAVYGEWKKRIGDIAAARKDAIIISDIPLLIEAGWQKDVDLVLLVYISPDEQVRRIVKRNGLSREEALDRLRSQMPIVEKIFYAHRILDNGGDIDRTRQAIDRLWPELLEMERARRKVPGSRDFLKIINEKEDGGKKND